MRRSAFAYASGLIYTLGSLAKATTSTIQFCKNEPTLAVEICIARNVFHNVSADAYDYYLTMGTAPSTFGPSPLAGWTAFAIGDRMDGSLMFLIYAGEASRKLVVSTRTTKLHYPPLPVEAGPEVQVIRSKINATWHEISIVCYSCSKWPGVPSHSEDQQWIWARNIGQEFEVASPDSHISQHREYGNFVMKAQGASKSAQEPFLGNTISQHAEEMHDIGEQPPEQHHHYRHSINVFVLHGMLCGLTFALIFPLATGVLRLGLRNSFRIHWIMQVTGTAACLLGVGIALKTSVWRLGLHQVVGGLLFFLLVVQIFSGWRHHLQYLQTSQRSGWSRYHIWMGKCTVLGGCINAALGLALAGQPAWVWSFFLSFCTILIVGIAIVLQRRKAVKFEAAKKPDHGILLDESFFSEGEEEDPTREMGSE